MEKVKTAVSLSGISDLQGVYLNKNKQKPNKQKAFSSKPKAYTITTLQRECSGFVSMLN